MPYTFAHPGKQTMPEKQDEILDEMTQVLVVEHHDRSGASL